MTDTPTVKDRRPKMPGAARASAILREHCRITPFMHQADGLACMMERFERFDSFGLLHDMGCGKTLTMLGGFLAMYHEGRVETMLVVCPSSVVGAWEREAEGILARGGIEIDVLALTHTKVDDRKKALDEWLAMRGQLRQTGQRVAPGIVAINYEATWRMEKELRRAKFDVDVCDESQRIKAAGSKQSLALYRIGKALNRKALSPRRVVMTGTPVPEGGLDWYGQFRFLDDRVFGASVTNFKRRYATEIDCGSFRKVIVNPYALPELEAKVMERVHRVSKEDAVDLPEQTHARLEFDLHPKQRKIYDDLVRDAIAFINEQEERRAKLWLPGDEFEPMAGDGDAEILGDNVLTRMLRLQQICGGYMQVHGRDSVEPCVTERGKPVNPKLKVLSDLMETLRDAGQKLVIFHRFTHEGQAILELAERLSGKHVPVSVINGSIKTADRKAMVQDFQEGEAHFFVAQIQAAAEGITLHAASDSAIYSSPFASAVFQQALARIHRIGQNHPVTHHSLLATGTIDETVFVSQMQKKDAADEMVQGGWERFLHGRSR